MFADITEKAELKLKNKENRAKTYMFVTFGMMLKGVEECPKGNFAVCKFLNYLFEKLFDICDSRTVKRQELEKEKLSVERWKTF